MSTKKIPTVVGLLVLVLGLGTGLFLVGQATLVPRASAEETPKEIKITNITENSFSVSWITEISTSGFIKYGTEAGHINLRLGDDRDQLSGNLGSFVTHHVTVRNLKPQTDYFFKIGSGTQSVLYDNSGHPYTLKTPAVAGTPPPADTIYGTILAAGTTPAEGAIVYVTLPGGSPMSTLSKAAGNWALSISTSRTADLASYLSYDKQSAIISLVVQAGGGKTATATTTTANDSPVPPITLGQNQDFMDQEGDQEATDSATLPPGADLDSPDLPDGTEASDSSDADDSGGFGDLALGNQLPDTSTFELDILNPEAEGEKVATPKPEMFGTSPANVTLTIVVESPTKYTDEVEVDEDGLWQWTPPANLTPGEHTVTVSYKDSDGVLQQVKRKFIVAAASGSAGLPAFEATPSASSSPSAAPRVSMPSTESGVPTSGVLTPTLVLFILGLGLLGVGVFWQLRLN